MSRQVSSQNPSHRPLVEVLEDRLAPAGLVATGSEAGRVATVKIFDALTGQERESLTPYGTNYRGGVRVAVGDVNADHIPDVITAPGMGTTNTIHVFNGRNLQLITSFTPFGANNRNGSNLAVGDVDHNGINEVIVAAAKGTAKVKSFNVLTGDPVQLTGALGTFLAFGSAFKGGATVAAGNVDGKFGDELIVGQGQGGRSLVKVLDGSRNLLKSLTPYGPSFGGGVYVASGDVNNDGTDEVITGPGSGRKAVVKIFTGLGGTVLSAFQAFKSGFLGGARVATSDVTADGRAEIIAAAGPGLAKRTHVFNGATFQKLTTVLPFGNAFQGGLFGAAANFSLKGDPANFQVKAEIPVLERLARFVPSAVPSVANWQTVAAADANLNPAVNGGKKNIYVIAHGWAPGFEDMVAMNSTPTDPLKWWETLNTALPGSPGNPASQEMFYGATGAEIVISPNGLANAILLADPDAVILAYSWIDESATGTLLGSIPQDAYLSEAYTTLNGYRLSNALQQALPGVFNANGGKLHLIGHSHGSKVVTVATTQLEATNNVNFSVDHLTILDSPETDSLLVRHTDSANNLWYFLSNLNIGRDPGEVFVDNYISEFDERIGVIQGFNPLNTSQQKNVLQEVVDVTLNGNVLYSSLDPFALGDLHGYSFSWYGGASQPWAQNPTPNIANEWSPLINPAVPPTLAGSYSQTWTASNQNQFQLTAGQQNNTASDTPTFTNLSLSDTTITNGSTYNANPQTVVLTETGASTATFTGEFKPLSNIDGISFNFQFNTPGLGDQLVISVNSGALGGYYIYFVMTGSVAGATQGFATLSLTSLQWEFFQSTYTVQMQLIPATGSPGASVTISNLQQFTN